MMILELKKEHIIEYKELVKCLWNDIAETEIDEIIQEHFMGKTRIFVFEKDQKLLGFMNLSIRNDYVEGSSSNGVGYLEGIYVCKQYRRNQIAYRLVKHAMAYFKKLGLTEFGSDTEIENQMSQIFHKAVGFNEVNTIKHYIMKIGD